MIGNSTKKNFTHHTTSGLIYENIAFESEFMILKKKIACIGGADISRGEDAGASMGRTA